MNFVCLHCGKAFDGESDKFCSPVCKNSHIADIERRTENAVREDEGHTNRMSRDK